MKFRNLYNTYFLKTKYDKLYFKKKDTNRVNVNIVKFKHKKVGKMWNNEFHLKYLVGIREIGENIC